ncbi:MAG: hypothetical protein C5B55_04215 [Blastocatellia bacterium]|nr:MAG: hypothetical protein C5B55_04215 [Blastocatellia bacterium]
MIRQLLAFAVATLLSTATSLSTSAAFSPVTNQEKQTKSKSTKQKSEEVDDEAAQRRAIGISLVTTLAEEARSFKDQTRRARVQARAADVLWDTDQERARDLFRRAWEAADLADSEAARQREEEARKQQSDGGGVVIRGGPDIRSEVLRLVAKRDRKLGEEFLKAFDEANEKARADADARRNDPDTVLGASKRLQLARRLAEEGQVERAMEFAGPALDRVSMDAIFFLSTLREKNASIADTAFANLIARAAQNPLSDANTVSGLSSYLFTPFLYVTFQTDGGSNQSRGRGPTPAPSVAPALVKQFMQVAYQILMQPLPAPDQDHTTSGRIGKYLVIKRLLPLFDENAPDLAPGLRTQMTALASYVPADFQQGENRALTSGLQKNDDEGDPLQRMQQRLDRAGKSAQRDAIYADYAVALSDRGDARAHDLVDKIEDAELRKNVKAYTDFQWTQLAVRNKDVNEIARLAKSGELNSVQRVWALTSAAHLVADSERARAVDLLEQALAESRRISASDPDRARALTAVASGLVDLDMTRAWETLAEVIKAANGAESFTGEDSRIISRLQTAQMVVMSNANAPDFDLITVFRALARADLMRSIQLVKGFTGEAPRAVATLAIARAVLEKAPERSAAAN